MATLEKPAGYMACAYAALIPLAQERARKLGYAIAVHGSMNRDLDLIAVPWTEDAKDPTVVHRLFVKLFCPSSAKTTEQPQYQPVLKPHGRIAWIIPLVYGGSINLSVVPPRRPV